MNGIQKADQQQLLPLFCGQGVLLEPKVAHCKQKKGFYFSCKDN